MSTDVPEGRRDRARHKARAVWHRAFVAGQALGVDVLPRHFYSAVPDVRALERDPTWRAPRSMAGVRGWDLEHQRAALTSWLTDDVRAELSGRSVHADACRDNGAFGFGHTEAQVLFAFVATQRPARIVQVGAGVATAVILAAAEWAGFTPQVTCVDPFPTDYLRDLGAAGRIELLAQRCQDVPLRALTDLGPGDLLFVDSTHTVAPGSEVNQIVLEVLPLLVPGARVHFHDIFWPYDYQRDLLDDALWFWTESTLLHAFMSMNERYSVEVATSYLHYEDPGLLARLVPGYRAQPNDDGLRASGEGHFPASVYLRS